MASPDHHGMYLDHHKNVTAQQYVIEAALPGFTPEELQITAVGETLTISAAKKGEEWKHRASKCPSLSRSKQRQHS